MHLDSLSTKANLFALNPHFWAEFIGSERWTSYCFVIKRYQMKYEPVLKPVQEKNMGEAFRWRKHFLEFYGRMKEL